MDHRYLYRYWRWLRGSAAGRWLFSRLIGWFNPYSGRLGASICELRPGYCRAVLRERRAIRNHLNSVHAIALTNFGELVSGLSVICAMPADIRGIPVEINSHYLKKARGLLTAESTTSLPDVTNVMDHKVSAEIRDQQGDTVAIIEVNWRLGLRET